MDKDEESGENGESSGDEGSNDAVDFDPLDKGMHGPSYVDQILINALWLRSSTI
jgi:hypothetical protein